MKIPAREAKEWAKEKMVGVMDAMPIACTADGEIDEAGLRKIVRYHFEGMKSDGIVALAGPEGFWYLTKEERKKYTEIVVDEAEKVRPGAPVIVGALCVSVKDVVELIRHAEGAGATAVILKNPVFATDEVGLYDFYRYVADNTDIAIALLNIGVGSFPMSLGLVARLAEDIPAICAIRGSGDVNKAIALKQMVGDKLMVSCFDSPSLASGLINPLGLVDPLFLARGSFLMQTPDNLIMRQFCYASMEGDLARAAEIYFTKLIHLVKLYYGGTVLGPTPGGGLGYNHPVVHYWAALLGVPVGTPVARPPMSPVTDEMKEKVRVGLVKAGLIKG